MLPQGGLPGPPQVQSNQPVSFRLFRVRLKEGAQPIADAESKRANREMRPFFPAEQLRIDARNAFPT